MRIGELSERTGTPARLLRYYEEQGLLTADRAANGYRDYTEGTVECVTQIRGLLDAGVPTRIIRAILPCLGQAGVAGIHVPHTDPGILQALEQHRDQMDAKIQCLARNRDAISAYLTAARDRATPPGQP